MIDIQRIVIGQMLISTEAYDQHFHLLKPGYFTDALCKLVYLTAINLKRKGLKLDLLTASTHLKGNEALNNLGGIPALIDLTKPIGQTSNIERDIALLSQDYIRSQMFAITSQAHMEAVSNINDPILTLNNLIKQLTSLTEIGIGKSQSAEIKNLTADLKTELKEKAEAYQKGIMLGIPTGINKMDEETGGWQPGETVVLGARPKIGKTALILFHARAAAKSGKKVAIFTLEISAKAVTSRLITGLAQNRINPLKFRKGNLTNDDFDAFNLAQSYLDEMPIYISDRCRTMSQIRSECRRLKKDEKLDFIILDFIQKVQPETKYPNREREVSAIMDELTFLAIELDVAVLAISRVNRQVESRPEKRAAISDLQDAGTIESNADMIILPFRAGAYDLQDKTNKLEYTVAANRNGSMFTIDLYHDQFMTNFTEQPYYQPITIPNAKPAQNWFTPEKHEF